MRTKPCQARGCRPGAADFWVFVLGTGFAIAVQAADVPVAVAPPQPVVIQPSAAVAPPSIPEAATATSAAVQPVAKGAKSAKGGKQAKPVKAAARQKAVKPASKHKAQAKKR